MASAEMRMIANEQMFRELSAERRALKHDCSKIQVVGYELIEDETRPNLAKRLRVCLL